MSFLFDPDRRCLIFQPADFRSHNEIARLPGVEIIPNGDVALGPRRGTYTFSRETVTRNLYRIPLP